MRPRGERKGRATRWRPAEAKQRWWGRVAQGEGGAEAGRRWEGWDGVELRYRQLPKDSSRPRQGPRAGSSCVVTLARTRRVEWCGEGCFNGR